NALSCGASRAASPGQLTQISADDIRRIHRGSLVGIRALWRNNLRASPHDVLLEHIQLAEFLIDLGDRPRRWAISTSSAFAAWLDASAGGHLGGAVGILGSDRHILVLAANWLAAGAGRPVKCQALRPATHIDADLIVH